MTKVPPINSLITILLLKIDRKLMNFKFMKKMCITSADITATPLSKAFTKISKDAILREEYRNLRFINALLKVVINGSLKERV